MTAAYIALSRARRVRRSRRPYKGPRLSRIVRQLGSVPEGSRVSIRELLDSFGDRAFGAIMLIFALPNAVPMPIVGVSAILGLPIVILAAQMAIGRRTPRLPEWIAKRSLTGSDFRSLTMPMVPVLARGERKLVPRWSWLTGAAGERVIGAVCLVLAVILFLPIPFANMLPAAAIALMSIGVLQKDGVAVVAGLALAVAAFSVAAGVVFAIVKTAMFVAFKIILN
jgi:hypothetical protein